MVGEEMQQESNFSSLQLFLAWKPFRADGIPQPIPLICSEACSSNYQVVFNTGWKDAEQCNYCL